MPQRSKDATQKRARKGIAGGVTGGSGGHAAAKSNGAAPVRPASLTGRAAEIWDQFAPDLHTIGMLTERDSLMFAAWCGLAAKIETGELSSALVTQFRLLGNDFGMSPSGKGREMVLPPPAAAAAKSKFFRD